MQTKLLAVLITVVLAGSGDTIEAGQSLVMSTSPRAVAVPYQTAISQVVLVSPKSHGRIDCLRDSQGLYRCSVNGTSKGVAGTGFQLLLWLKPVQPSGDGWYLQRGKVNGIHSLERSGAWRGIAQIGNLEYPPHEKDIVDIEVTIVTTDEAQALMTARDVAVRGDPVGTVSDTAKDVKVHLR